MAIRRGAFSEQWDAVLQSNNVTTIAACVSLRYIVLNSVKFARYSVP